MMLVLLGIILSVLLVLALIWKPSRGSVSTKSSAIEAVMQSMSTPTVSPRVDPLDMEIGIIAEAIRESDHKRRKAAAMARLRELLDES